MADRLFLGPERIYAGLMNNSPLSIMAVNDHYMHEVSQSSNITWVQTIVLLLDIYCQKKTSYVMCSPGLNFLELQCKPIPWVRSWSFVLPIPSTITRPPQFCSPNWVRPLESPYLKNYCSLIKLGALRGEILFYAYITSRMQWCNGYVPRDALKKRRKNCIEIVALTNSDSQNERWSVTDSTTPEANPAESIGSSGSSNYYCIGPLLGELFYFV